MALRTEIFHREQGIALELMSDEQDPDALHFLLYLEGDKLPSGTARMLANGRIGRVAVSQPLRGQGLGEALMRYLHDIALQLDLEATHLHAQQGSLPFYERLGYRPQGEPFVEAGIPHQAMQRPVAPANAPIEFTAVQEGPRPIIKAPSPEDYQPRATRPADDPVQTDASLGSTGAIAPLKELDQVIDHIAALIAQADEQVFIYAPTLNPQLFAHPKVLDAISAAARRNPFSRVQILVSEISAMVKQHHPLLQLQQRINSLISLRCTIPAYPLDSHALVLADDCGWLELVDDNPLCLCGNFNDGPRVKQWRERIKYPWNHSVIPQDIRQMSL
ncbi:GNAT family N-acetyltransferase [Aestuariirhabdus litorea]|nr:GNAT family N-acetyltransferase [Aestuariirhabdus litorea]